MQTPPFTRRSPANRVRDALGVALLWALGCELADFEVERSGYAVISADDDTDEVEVMRLDGLEIVLAEIEDTEDIGTEDISRAEIRKLTIEVVHPLGSDLAFVDRIEIFADSPDLGRVRVAYADELPRGEARVDLEIDGVDLQKYIAAPTATLIAVIDGTAPEREIRVLATAKLEVGATVRGACDHR